MAYVVDEVQEPMDFIKRHAPEPGDDVSWLFIESVNGVMTPCFSGLPQAEVYRPLGFPVVLVGSREFDGVSVTISAFESLSLRGYNVVAVMVTGGHGKNSRYVDQYFERYVVPPVNSGIDITRGTSAPCGCLTRRGVRRIPQDYITTLVSSLRLFPPSPTPIDDYRPRHHRSGQLYAECKTLRL